MRGRPSSASGMASTPVDPSGLGLPHRPDAEQGERLGDVVALGAGGGGAPQDQPDRVGVRPLLGQVPFEQLRRRVAGRRPS